MPSTLGFINSKLLFCLLVTSILYHSAFVTSKPTGFSLRAVIDDSPESPLYLIENLTIAERLERLIKISYARVNYLNLVSSGDAKLVPDNIRIPMLRDALYYAVAFTIGSQGHPVKLLMDTGGGLIWTQCLPCPNCFPQKLPIYNPAASTSYATLPCSHPFCNGDRRLYNCEHGRYCVYNAQYSGGASTSAIASTEAFHFFVDQHSTHPFNVIFGCSYDSRDIAFMNTDISGIFGLSFSPDSMASQFSALIQHRFSYCLAPFDDVTPRPLVLRFGEDIPQLPPQSVGSTQLIASPTSYFFYLGLKDISVAGHRIGFPPSIFQIKPNGLGGFFIDSGALFTHIDADALGGNAYAEVLKVFAAYYGSKYLKQTGASPEGFELCYERPPNFDEFATLTFHFDESVYTVNGQYMHVIAPNFFCVGILKGSSVSVLGAWQQQNKRIIYDGGRGVLEFADENCMNDIA
ncbi:hypothetical protein ES319_A13G155300v1 [Gossypium barbadense]|uniref:Peptidase A1 domain-containing protein n=2 Tax=Gossypium TaxID=3633 RepID=A0A2P5YHY8_GOSBA|nr:hypothetical protein ES319_A13G155300v1 [Gossypium barbadense]PPS15200.1 hypothetical protein GOBAR_AA05368 [Gossypium barbadense]TYG86853.1 hypothetical protein ES288_A13G165900v1 [Gossypium darwinii]